MSDEATPISAMVGAQLREWRQAARLRQDEVARAARALGFRWTRATIAAIEGGRRDVSLGEFAALPFITASHVGRGRWRRLPGFLLAVPARPVALGPDVWMRSNDLQTLFGGSAVGLEGKVPISALYSRPQALREIRRRVNAENEAEMKAARQLGIDEVQVTAAAVRLWGRTLTVERDARVAARAEFDDIPRSIQALRGHVTRELLAELRRERGRTRTTGRTKRERR